MKKALLVILAMAMTWVFLDLRPFIFSTQGGSRILYWVYVLRGCK